MPSEGNRAAQTGNESASYDAACCASSFTGGIQSEALCPETPGSQEPDSLGFATSVDIEESPKSLRLQCSCGVIHQLKHIRTRKGARLLLSQPSSQSSRTSQPQVRSFVSEELRSVLFGDRSSNSDFLHNSLYSPTCISPRADMLWTLSAERKASKSLSVNAGFAVGAVWGGREISLFSWIFRNHEGVGYASTAN
jgi:hypothetical protein